MIGLGKTVITLTAIKELKFNRFAVNKVLVIAPKKVAEGTWQAECEKWEHTKDLRLSTVLGSKQERLDALNKKADIYIINRENVTWLEEHYKNKWPFDMVVVDEFSSFKNRQSKRFKSLARMKPHINRLVGLTGTPSPQSLMDLWSQLYLIDKGERLGKNFTNFRDNYFTAGQRSGYVVFNWRLRPGAEDEILNKISDVCISMKAKDYLELPTMIENEIKIKLSPKSQKAYDKMERQAVLELADGDIIDAPNAAALSNKLLQISNGAVYNEDHEWSEIHSDKIDALKEVIESLQGKPVLLFYNFQHDKERIIAELKKGKAKFKVLEGVKEQEMWNNGEIGVLLAHPASAAYGLNLQKGGCNIIWFGLTWNSELYDQANARLHRQGQKDKVYIHKLIIEGSRDEDVVKALKRKGKVQDYVLETLKARISKYKSV